MSNNTLKSWAAVGGFAFCWGVSYGRPFDWTAFFPVTGGLIAAGFFVESQMERHIDKLIERDLLTPKDTVREQSTPASSPPPDGLEPLRMRAQFPKVHINQYSTVHANLLQPDKRWQDFAYDVVVYRTPMTQAKWTGRNRPFSRGEFSTQMNQWLTGQIIKPKNLKNLRDGFIPRGGRGHEYFCALARGEEWIPLPHSD